MRPIHPIGPLIPFLCTYWWQGKPYGLTVWDTSEANVKRTHPNVTVEGVLIGEIDQ